MNGPFFLGVGGVVSGDIAVPEHAKELAFYSKVLTTGIAPFWRDDLSNRHGTPIIGLGERTPEYESIPLQWMPHCQVADVAASAARASEMGGTELMHGKDGDGNSQWAALADPNGVAFGIIPIVDEEATAGAYQPDGTPYISWLSLVSPGVEASCDFYESVVGWTTMQADGSGRREIRRGDGAIAGEISPVSPDTSTPPVWVLYLPVDDLDESLRRAAEHGGKIIREPGDSGRAVVQDPVGACFGLESRG